MSLQTFEPETRREQARRRLIASIRRSLRKFGKELRIIRRALVHPEVPWYAKLVAWCSILYVFSPIQLLPNFIPVLGQMDDVLVVSLGTKFLRKRVSPSVLEGLG